MGERSPELSSEQWVDGVEPVAHLLVVHRLHQETAMARAHRERVWHLTQQSNVNRQTTTTTTTDEQNRLDRSET